MTLWRIDRNADGEYRVCSRPHWWPLWSPARSWHWSGASLLLTLNSCEDAGENSALATRLQLREVWTNDACAADVQSAERVS
jgi:hypothetical protein